MRGVETMKRRKQQTPTRPEWLEEMVRFGLEIICKEGNRATDKEQDAAVYGRGLPRDDYRMFLKNRLPS